MLHRLKRALLLSCTWACLCFVLSLGARTASGASYYDPALPYRTVQNAHVAVHYPPGARNLAIDVLRRAGAILHGDAALLGNLPEGIIDIVLTDTQDDANGSAQVVPKNILRLFLAAPTELTGLAFYDDWLDILLTHELAHLVDIDQTRGFTRFLRRIFGRTVAYNGSTPQFLSEGVAVYAETKLTHAGRGRSSYVETLLRTAALANTFPTLDQAHIFYGEFPFGNAAYFFGGRFHLYLSERFGEDAVAKLHTYYASQLLPLVYGPGAYRILGQSLPQLWRDFAAAERAYGEEVAVRVTAEGLSPTRPLTSHGRDLTGGIYSPDGRHVLYARRSPIDGPTVRWLQLDGLRERALALDTFSHRFSFDSRSDGFVYSQAAITHRFDNFGELYFWDFARARRIHLRDEAAPNDSLRARDPTFTPDGTELAFVQTRLLQSYIRTAEVVRDADGRPKALAQVRDLLPPSGDVQYASPAFSPDGSTLAVSVWLPGGLRDIHLMDAKTGQLLRRITQDKAQDGNPCFSPDGAYLLYESDADGISNIYAYRLADGAYAKVSNLIGGAYQPHVSPDGRRILIREAVGNGFDLHELPFAPETWHFGPYSPAQGYGTPEPADASRTDDPLWAQQALPAPAPRDSEPPLALDANAHESEAPYSPWRTLVPGADNWLLVPNLSLINNLAAVSLTTFGQDVLARHFWAAQVGYTQRSSVPNVALNYTNDRLLPTFAFDVAQSATPYAATGGYAMEIDTGAAVRVLWPFRNRHQLSLGYQLLHRRGNRLAREQLPLGRTASVQAGYSYRFARNFAYGISPEHGRALSLSATYFSPKLGGLQEELLVGADGRAYINNPLFDNHVLALRLTVNYALGPDRVQSFFLYGTQGASLLTQQSGRLFNLRGFLPNRGPFGAPRSGTGLVAGYGEYRLPLWHVQRGIGSWPIFFEHLHLAAFADAGNTFGTLVGPRGQVTHRSVGWAAQHLWLSAGAEVRLDVVFAWRYGATLRLGVAQGMLAAGTRVVDRATPLAYFDLGTTL